MIDQNTFMETLHGVQDIVRTSAEPMSREEILSYFKDMDLDRQQEELVFEFLSTPHEEDDVAEGDKEETGRQEEAGLEEEPGTNPGENVSGTATGNGGKKEDAISESPVFQMYQEELKEIPRYNEEQMTGMYKKLLAGDESMVHQISNAWLPNVLETAKKLVLSPEGIEDVVQEGNMALFLRLSELCGSGEKVDVEVELLAAAESAMKDCIREQTGENEQESAVVGKVALVNEAVRYLREQNGHEPSRQEIADYVKISGEELSNILNLIEKAENRKLRKTNIDIHNGRV